MSSNHISKVVVMSAAVLSLSGCGERYAYTIELYNLPSPRAAQSPGIKAWLDSGLRGRSLPSDASQITICSGPVGQDQQVYVRFTASQESVSRFIEDWAGIEYQKLSQKKFPRLEVCFSKSNQGLPKTLSQMLIEAGQVKTGRYHRNAQSDMALIDEATWTVWIVR